MSNIQIPFKAQHKPRFVFAQFTDLLFLLSVEFLGCFGSSDFILGQVRSAVFWNTKPGGGGREGGILL